MYPLLNGNEFQGKRKRTLTSADKKRVAANQRWKCKRCNRTLPARFHIDHIKEFASGGSDKDSNLEALCPNCHADKHEEARHREKQKKITRIERRESVPSNPLFSGAGLFSTPKAQTPSYPRFDIPSVNLFGDSKPTKRKKKKSDFGFF